MDKNTFESTNFIGQARILLAPLDWGLGHATRCIPIICGLIEQGHTVLIAAEGPTKKLLEQEFPNIEYLPLKGYKVKYAKRKSTLAFSILRQIPKIIGIIIFENNWLNRIIENKKIDIVISDNRFGLYNKNAHCVFITHQLLIKTPFLQGLLQKLNYRFINKFNECWVPDFYDEPSLADRLSHPKKMPSIPVRDLGLLSRFKKPKEVELQHILILLSGPEPQRTILEQKILKQLNFFPKPVLIVRGLPDSGSVLEVQKNVKYVNHLAAKQLEEAIHSSFFVIARCGYSTVMDLIKLQKKTILIPTPGQTEQEYLAKHLFTRKMAFCAKQESFDLKKALDTAKTFQYSFLDRNDATLLHEALAFKNFDKLL